MASATLPFSDTANVMVDGFALMPTPATGTLQIYSVVLFGGQGEELSALDDGSVTLII